MKVGGSQGLPLRELTSAVGPALRPPSHHSRLTGLPLHTHGVYTAPESTWHLLHPCTLAWWDLSYGSLWEG